MANEYPREYDQQDVTVINRVLSSIQSSSFPATKIASPLTPPLQVCTSHLDSGLSTTAHNHSCDCCGSVFTCEMECKPATEQYCEYCAVWMMGNGRSTNKQRLADYLDDQVVIEEVRLQAAKKDVSGGLTRKEENE